jgi:hypothetical protein
MITRSIVKRLTISGSKVNIMFNGSLNNPVISKRRLIEKILNILLLREKEPHRRGELNPKKVKNWSLRCKKLRCLNKGNIVRVISNNNHNIHIKKEKSPTTRWNVKRVKSWALAEKSAFVLKPAIY